MAKAVNVLVIRPEGPAEKAELRGPSQERLQGFVGGWLEVIYGQGWAAYVNEEGTERGLPPNRPATDLAVRLGWLGRGRPVLLGPVVFFGPATGEGEEGDVPEFVLEAWEAMRQLDPRD
jgi:hypothetical protein